MLKFTYGISNIKFINSRMRRYEIIYAKLDSNKFSRELGLRYFPNSIELLLDVNSIGFCRNSELWFSSISSSIISSRGLLVKLRTYVLYFSLRVVSGIFFRIDFRPAMRSLYFWNLAAFTFVTNFQLKNIKNKKSTM